MSITLAIRGNSLDARYSTNGKTPGLFTTSGSVSKPAVEASADDGSIGGSNIDQFTSAATRALIYPGISNFPSTNNFSVLQRIKMGYSGSPATVHTFWCAMSPTDTIGGRIQFVHHTDGKFGAQLVNEYNTALISQLTGDAGNSAWSPTENSYYDIVFTYDGSATTNALKIYIDGTLHSQFTASAAYATSAENRQNKLVTGIGIGVADTAIRVDFKLNEFVLWDSVIDPTSVALTSGTGSLNGSSRSAFVDVAALDGLAWTALTADKIKTGEAQTQAGVVVNGTYTGSDRWSDVGIANVRSGSAYKADSLTNNRTGTAAIPSAENTKIGVAVDATTGTYDGSDRFTSIDEDHVKHGFDYKDNSTTENKTGTYRAYDLWDAADPSIIKYGEELLQDGETITGTLTSSIVTGTRNIANVILQTIGASTLTDEEFESMDIEITELNQEAYIAILAIVDGRDLVSNTRDRLTAYFVARGVNVSDGTQGKSNILIGSRLN